MKRKLSIILAMLIALPVQALAALTGEPLTENCPVDLDCLSAILCEPESGQVILAQNADEKRPVASVTKTMTILLTLEAISDGRISPDDVVTVSKNASGMGGSQVLLDTGECQTVSQLLKSVIVCSANDSAVALAECTYGSEELFVSYMNERASELGLMNTHFENCTGLPIKGQYTTARDVAVIFSEIIRHKEYFEYSKIWLENFDHGDGRVTQMTNTNKLTRLYEGCDGGKTGSTDEAGFCLAATAMRGGMRLIAVVLGSSSSTGRFDSAAAMFDYGFANFRRYPVAEKGTPIKGGLPVNGGSRKNVSLALDGDLTLLIPKGGEQDITLNPSLPDSLDAPIKTGERVGSVDVLLNGKKVASLDIVTSEAIEATGMIYILKRIVSLWTL